jgi:hypothetical protein
MFVFDHDGLVGLLDDLDGTGMLAAIAGAVVVVGQGVAGGVGAQLHFADGGGVGHGDGEVVYVDYVEWVFERIDCVFEELALAAAFLLGLLAFGDDLEIDAEPVSAGIDSDFVPVFVRLVGETGFEIDFLFFPESPNDFFLEDRSFGFGKGLVEHSPAQDIPGSYIEYPLGCLIEVGYGHVLVEGEETVADAFENGGDFVA